MAKAVFYAEKRYSLRLDDLTVHQVNFLRDISQNSPMGYDNPNDEPHDERELRQAIFEACKQILL